MNPAVVLAAARRAQAAYIMDAGASKSAFEALGYQWIGQTKDHDSQAVLSSDSSGAVYLSISGTRFSDRQLGDLFDDMDLCPVHVGDGAYVTRGAYEGLTDVWQWAKELVPVGTIFNVEGHSLGGWRASYTPLFLPATQIGALHCFEPPKGANAAYYAKFATELASMVIVGNGRDIWMNYPRLGDWLHRPGPMIWLQSKGYQEIDTAAWPGGFSLGDHSIDLVVERLAAVVEPQPQAA
jgi:pimeloyl-ACP methyl ester carboxylesterase